MEENEKISVENLTKKREDTHTEAYLRFALQVGHFPNDLFCFYENKDADYYYLRIDKYFCGKNQPIKCGNKKKVIGTHNLISKKDEYNKYKKAYFVDRDFDDSIHEMYPSIYETPCYSIENLYCTKDVVSEILKNKLDLLENSKEYNKWLDLYSNLQNQYLDAILVFNAWYSCHIDSKNKKEKESSEEIMMQLKLEHKLPTRFIKIELTGIQKNYGMNEIKELYPNALEITEDKLKSKIEEFKSCNKIYTFRGKYVLELLYQFLDQISQDNSFKGKVKFHVERTTLLNQLTVFAETPESLITYLGSFN